MAIVSTSVPVHVQQPRMERGASVRGLSSSASARSSSSSASSLREIEEEPAAAAEEEKVYVAVPKELKEGKALLGWVLQNTPREANIVLAHVYVPAQTIPMMSQLTGQQVRAYRQLEKEKINKSLDEYVSLCSQLKFRAEKLVIEMDEVAKGLVKLIVEHGITKFVMGAAADKHFSKKMKGPRSKTALSVQQEADPSCKIWFICKGNHICTKDAGLNGSGIELSTRTSPSSSSGQSEQLRSRSLPQGRSESYNWLSNSMRDLFNHRSRSEHYDSDGGSMLTPIASDGQIRTTNSANCLGTERSAIDPWEGIPRVSEGSDPSSISVSGEQVSNSGPSIPRDEESDVGSVMLPSVHESEEDLQFSSPRDELEVVDVDDEVYDKLQHALANTENARRAAYEESCRRLKAERDAVKAHQKAKASESLYIKEMKQRKETEETLAREKMELERLRKERDDVLEELQKAQEQKLALEMRIAESDRIVRDFDEKLSTAQHFLRSLRREHEEMRQERDNLVREASELRQRNEEPSTSNPGAINFSLFSYSELEQATQNFDDSLKIGEGGYGSVYKGFLRHTTVAIKILNPQGRQGISEFHQEVDVLSRIRHPNLVTLIGTCPEAGALVYEYLPGGSLEDRLVQKHNTPPLSWQVRTRIAAEICSALIFLHSSKPYGCIHGDIKPANILLDSNFVSKLADFGICRLLKQSNNNTTLYRHTHPKGTFVYMDPEFLATGELTSRSDIYSFGVVILRLLTRRPALGLIKDVQEAMSKGCLHDILDHSAGDWPYVQAKQLAQLALKCCEIKRKRRPNLAGEGWKVLESLTKAASSMGSPAMSFKSASDDSNFIPSYFMCPISKDIMRDPHIAADGFTYEAEALKGWIEEGNETSPMTNLKLAHCELIPNLSLRSAIQEWLQQEQQHK